MLTCRRFPQAAHFHCSWHRRQNIIKTCGGSADLPGSALWLFNLLSNCKTLNSIKYYSEKYESTLHPTDAYYLSKLPNEMQYPAARCSMGEDVYMYNLSASSGSESMNRANMPIRREAAVNAINASLQLLQLENKRYDQFKKEAWGHTQPLTPREMKLMEDIFQDVEVNEYYCDELVMDTYDDCDVSRLVMNSTIYTVKIPKVSTNRSA